MQEFLVRWAKSNLSLGKLEVSWTQIYHNDQQLCGIIYQTQLVHVIAIVPATNGAWTHQVECHRSIRSAGSNHRCRVLALPAITNFPTFAQRQVAKYLIYLDLDI